MNPPSLFNKTRIAPTPSGFLHLGNILSFSLTATLARNTKAAILLRIDDLDQQRAGKEYVQDIFDTLNFLEIPWDQGPADPAQFSREYSQLHRLPLYHQALDHLKASGTVFACTCSRGMISRDSINGAYPGTCRHRGLPLDTPGAAWRLNTTAPLPLRIKTFPSTHMDATLPPEMQDFVVRKRDGFPAYQLTSLIDDLHYGIDLIIRGKDLWPSTLAQHYLSYQLDAPAFRNATFHHHPLLTTTSGEKLSKSAGSTSIQHLRKQGLKPAEIHSMIARHLGSQELAGSWEELAGLILR